MGVSTDWLLGVTEELTPPPGSVAPGPAAPVEPGGPAVGVDLAPAPEDPPESSAVLPADDKHQGEWVRLEWISPERKPQNGQLVALMFDFGGAGKTYQLGRWAEGCWQFTGGTPMAAKPTGWFPLPDIEEVKDHD